MAKTAHPRKSGKKLKLLRWAIKMPGGTIRASTLYHTRHDADEARCNIFGEWNGTVVRVQVKEI